SSIVSKKGVCGLDVAVGGSHARTNQRDSSGARDFKNPVRPHQIDERFDLSLVAGDLNHHRTRADVDDLAAENLGQMPDVAAAFRRTDDLDQHQIAFNEALFADVLHLDDGDDFLELLADLFDHGAVAMNDESHAREFVVFGFADGEGIDVERT